MIPFGVHAAFYPPGTVGTAQPLASGRCGWSWSALLWGLSAVPASEPILSTIWGARGAPWGGEVGWVPVGSAHSQELGPIPDAGCAPWRASSPCPPCAGARRAPCLSLLLKHLLGGLSTPKKPHPSWSCPQDPQTGHRGLTPCRQRSHRVPPFLHPLAVGCPKQIDFIFPFVKKKKKGGESPVS